MIRINADITIYRYDEDAEKWHRFTVQGVHWYDAAGESAEKAGFSENEKAIVRVFGSEEISCGDYIRRGSFFSENPDKNACLRVISVTDNRQSRLLPHRKLGCA